MRLFDIARDLAGDNRASQQKVFKIVKMVDGLELKADDAGALSRLLMRLPSAEFDEQKMKTYILASNLSSLEQIPDSLLAPILKHLELSMPNESIKSASPAALDAAAQSWREEPSLPFEIASSFGLQGTRQQLLAGLAWRSSSVKEAPTEKRVMPAFQREFERLSSQSLRQLATVLHAEGRHAAAIAIVHPELPADKNTLLAHAIQKVSSPVDPVDAIMMLDPQVFGDIHLFLHNFPDYRAERTRAAIAALPMSITFGDMWHHWLSANQMIGRDERAALVNKIGFVTDPQFRFWVIANAEHPLPLLEEIAAHWSSIPDLLRQQSFENIARYALERRYDVPALNEMVTTKDPEQYDFLQNTLQHII
jgi:hypothetical protein